MEGWYFFLLVLVLLVGCSEKPPPFQPVIWNYTENPVWINMDSFNIKEENKVGLQIKVYNPDKGSVDINISNCTNSNDFGLFLGDMYSQTDMLYVGYLEFSSNHTQPENFTCTLTVDSDTVHQSFELNFRVY